MYLIGAFNTVLGKVCRLPQAAKGAGDGLGCVSVALKRLRSLGLCL